MRVLCLSVLSLLLLLAPSAARAQADDGAGPGGNTQEDWKFRPFFKPEGGLSAWTSSSGQTSTAVSLGAQAGLYFWQTQRKRPRIEGLTRARGVQLFGSGATGTELRLGAFAGPAWGKVRLQTGPDIYWDRYQWGAVTLAPTTGLAWPVQATASLSALTLLAGVEPSFFLRSERPSVDWDTQDGFGFGDEFTWFVGGNVGTNVAGLNVTYSQTTTAFGVQRGFGVGVRVRG